VTALGLVAVGDGFGVALVVDVSDDVVVLVVVVVDG
jgi:hypothetical protein